MKKILVIGGGAAGMMAAIAAAKSDVESKITLIEKNEKLGKKIFITGKGRCNVTNACEVEELFSNVLEHSKFLYSAIYGFDNQAVMSFFEEAGCALKVERGQRVFPESDHSSDVIRVLERQLKQYSVDVLLNHEVRKVNCEELMIQEEPLVADEMDKYARKKSAKKKMKQTLVVKSVDVFDKKRNSKTVLNADAVIIATGGISYVLTGSTGDGLKFAKKCGHTITPLSPALVPFSIEEEWCYSLQGLSLKNVQAQVELNGKTIYSDFGEMLFTHYGVSGPLMLSASSYYVHQVTKAGKKDDEDAILNKKVVYPKAKLYIDLKPALTKEQLDKRILRDFDENKNKQFKNAISGLFPTKLLPIMPMLADIDPDKKVNEVTKEERERFVNIIKHMELTITGVRDYNEAIITKGGVSVNEVTPSTMESKLVSGLYFAGEVLDLDALTGGFNLQIAWSTGYLAGVSSVMDVER